MLTGFFSSSTFFGRATSPSPILYLYQAYSKLLKSNAGGVWKITILDGDTVITAGWSRVITIWAVNYSLLHESRRPCRRYKQYPLINGTANTSVDIVYDASHRSYIEEKLSKNHLWSLIWKPLNTSPPKVEKPMCEANFHARQCEMSLPGKKYIFSLWGIPLVGL